MAIRLLSTALIFGLVVCPYTCDRGCCADAEPQNHVGTPGESGGCSACSDAPTENPVPLQPTREQNTSTKCNCICAGAITKNVDDSAFAVETLRIVICCQSEMVGNSVIPLSPEFRNPNSNDAACPQSGRALRTAIGSLIC